MPEELAIARDTRIRLARLAAETRRTDSDLANEALERFLEYEEWAVTRIREGLAAADRGALVEDDRVAAWIDSLGTENELPMPRSGVR